MKVLSLLLITYSSAFVLSETSIVPSISLAGVFEPLTMLLFGCGLITLAGLGRKKLSRRDSNIDSQ